MLQDLNYAETETAHRIARRSLHEQHDLVLMNNLFHNRPYLSPTLLINAITSGSPFSWGSVFAGSVASAKHRAAMPMDGRIAQTFRSISEL